MNNDGSSLSSLLAWAAFFAVTSLFAVGGANSAIPEIHRYAVDVQHWLSARQFADSFALAQLTPGPNLIIVTLIGYHVAGIAGAVVATLAMCTPTFCGRPRLRALQRRGLARRAQPRARTGNARTDGGERHRDRQRRRLQLGRGGNHAGDRVRGVVHARASALGLRRRGTHWRSWPHLTGDLAPASFCPHGVVRD